MTIFHVLWNAMRAFSGHLIGIELLGPLMGD